ncbi:Tryptophan synthase beta chain 2 [Rhizophlyctis rosea]|nr:Tryptophan synthase beta chain 2 [Rhizophlyctis rosea]
MTDNATKYILPDEDVPKQWYNILSDLPTPLPPPLHPGTKQPIGPEALSAILPQTLIEQEVSTERWIDIPEPVREVYKKWRPAPLFRAWALEKALGTPAKIYYKYEGVSPAGSHKPNTAVPQVYYNKISGTTKITTETGAGQWGSALAFAGSQFGVDIEVYQVRSSFETKPYRRILMNTYGARCLPSPSTHTATGRAILSENPDTPGSLGIAISEAIEACTTAENHETTKYCLGSVLNHVLMHQSVIGLEAMKQLEMAGVKPDVIVGCTGGGSNFAGIAFPFLGQRFRHESTKPFRCVAVEPSACPSLTKGKYTYDFGDTAGLTPLLKSHTLGHTFTPPPLHAGGLRYHGMAPLVSHLYNMGEIEAIAVSQKECFEAGVLFAKTEGILPAPESNHAVRGAILEAERCKREGREEVILFCLSGNGNLDMTAYEKFNAGELEVEEPFDEKSIVDSLKNTPAIEE